MKGKQEEEREDEQVREQTEKYGLMFRIRLQGKDRGGEDEG